MVPIMGMDYRLLCLDCEKETEPTEFSVVGHVSLKYGEWQETFVAWCRFLVDHPAHRIAVVDSRGKLLGIDTIKE
jgi:hypothetical protein